MIRNWIKSPKIIFGAAAILCLIGIIPLMILSVFPSNAMDNRNPFKKKEMMMITLEWGRLAPFPANATNVAIETEGGSFTRSFRASFSAPEEDIRTWIRNSPGLNEATPTELSDHKFEYRITPGGGANMAKVTIDFTLNKVDIYVSWS
jgi:hypothetical protein